MTQEHVTEEEISAFVDGEMNATDAQRLREHVADCHGCAMRVIDATQLKTAVSRAGRQTAPPPDVMSRLTAQLNTRPSKNIRKVQVMGPVAWTLLAATLLLVIGLLGWGQIRSQNALTAELLDQHLATLSSAAAPEIISTDRHTVKPWFEGKLPFSFNLPEPNALPNDMALVGGDLAYLEGRPAALLLFHIHKHQVSVFVAQRGSFGTPAYSRSGFSMHTANARELQFAAVGDVNTAELDALLSALVKGQ